MVGNRYHQCGGAFNVTKNPHSLTLTTHTPWLLQDDQRTYWMRMVKQYGTLTSRRTFSLDVDSDRLDIAWLA
jgi:hypothetical protein